MIVLIGAIAVFLCVFEVPPERLANNSALTEQQKLDEASRQFESILLKQILDSTQNTVITSKFSDNSTSADIYRDMITTQLADSISKSGAFGLAKTLEHQLARQSHIPPEAAAGAVRNAQPTLPSGAHAHRPPLSSSAPPAPTAALNQPNPS